MSREAALAAPTPVCRTGVFMTDLPYRACVGVVLARSDGLIFTGERVDTPGAWQMPQGGISGVASIAVRSSGGFCCVFWAAIRISTSLSMTRNLRAGAGPLPMRCWPISSRSNAVSTHRSLRNFVTGSEAGDENKT